MRRDGGHLDRIQLVSVAWLREVISPDISTHASAVPEHVLGFYPDLLLSVG